MLCQLIEMPWDFNTQELQKVSRQLFDELGDMKVCAFPELEEWLDERLEISLSIYPEDLPIKETLSQVESFQLTKKELKRTLDPNHDTIYSIKDPNLFTKFFMVTQTGSNLSPVFAPYEVTRLELIRLIHLGAYGGYSHQLGCPKVKKIFVTGQWLFSVGICSVNEEENSVLFMCDSHERNARVKKIFHPFAERIRDFQLVDGEMVEIKAGE